MNKKELNPDSSPQAAFGARVRSSREEKGWTQEELASRMEYSSTHISAVETGRKLPTLRLARSADQALQTGDVFERLWREVRHGVLLEGFPEFVGYEARAVELRLFEAGIIPGLLQTPEYARALANAAARRGSITAEQANERVALLAERQTLFTRPKPPLVLVVLDESCIRRPVGGAEVMAGQLERLVEFAELPHTMLQVAPYEIGERRPFNMPVRLLTLADRSIVAYTESQMQGHLERDNRFVLPLLTEYHQLQAEALSQAASVALIRQA